MKNAHEILKQVNDFLASLPYERKPKSLYEPVEYVLSLGGKRIRPVLMLMGYNLWRQHPEDILMPATSGDSTPKTSSCPPLAWRLTITIRCCTTT